MSSELRLWEKIKSLWGGNSAGYLPEKDPIHIPAIFLILPMASALVTPVVIAAISIIAIAIMLAVSGGLIGAGTQGGHIIGAIVGAVIVFLIAQVVIVFAYGTVPVIPLIITLYGWITITLIEEIKHCKFVTNIFSRTFHVKPFVVLSVFLLGQFTLLIFFLFSRFGLFVERYDSSNYAREEAFDNLIYDFSTQANIIAQPFLSIELLSILFVLVGSAWLIFIYFGINYILSRSIRYCISIVLIAFALDFLFTGGVFVFIDKENFTDNSFLLYLNQVDSDVRRVTMMPLELISFFTESIKPLLAAIREFFSLLNDMAFMVVEMNIRIVVAEDSFLYALADSFVEFARFLKLDFLFFIIASVLQYAKSRILNTMRKIS